MQRSKLKRQLLYVIVEEEQIFQKGTHSDLRRQLRDLVERSIQVTQLAKLANLFGQAAQLVGCDVQFVQELVLEELRRKVAQSLTAHVHVVPILPIGLSFCEPRTPPVRRIVFAVSLGSGGVWRKAADAFILRRLEPGVIVRLLLLDHSGMCSLCILLHPKLILPHLIPVSLAGPGRRRVAIRQCVGAEMA